MKIKNLVLCTTLAFTAPAFAMNGFIGGGLGLSDITLKSGSFNYGVSAGLSLEGGLEVMPGLSLGLESQYYWKALAGGLASVSIMPLLFNTRYHVSESLIDGAYFGVSLGFARESVEVLGQSVSSTELAAGAQAGYNFAMSDAVGLGPKVTFLRVFGSPKAYNFWSTLANVHYMF